MGILGQRGKRVPVEERFWKHVDRRGPDECWLWAGDRFGGGYGRIYDGGKLDKKALLAHRLSLEMYLGRKLLPHECAMHSCDNPPCVNPAHLRPGTKRENNRDMWNKGRGVHNHAKALELAGKRIGKLVFLEQDPTRHRKSIRWLCRCDCGRQCVVVASNVVAGLTNSCGCLRYEKKVSTAQRDEIVRRHESGESARALAKEFGIATRHVYTIRKMVREAAQ